MNKTSIEWTDYTWNPVTGCNKISQGCKNCYAEIMATRFWGDRKFTDVQMHEDRLMKPLQMQDKISGKRVFVCDVSDLFHEAVSFTFITKVFITMGSLPQTTFQVLTKRPNRALEWFKSGIVKNMPSNIWIGTSVENQEQADIRIPLLLQIPAAVRFLSCEPLIGELLLIKYFSKLSDRQTSSGDAKRDWFEGRLEILPNNSINWVIAGGESGHGARPMHPNWVRFLKNQCAAFNVPFFFKQWGQWLPHCQVAIRGTALEVFKRTYKSVVWSDDQAFYRTGKKESGNLLDGKQHLAFPTSTHLNMDRPEQIWLPEPVVIHGIKVSRTLQGLKYYLHHWQHVQATAGSKLDQAAKQHLQLVIDNLKIHVELTEKQNAIV